MNTQGSGYRAKDFEAHHLAFFFLAAFGLTWLAAAVAYLIDLTMPTGVADPVSPLSALIGILGATAPSLAAFLMTAFTEGQPEVKALWKGFWNRNVSLKWLIAILFCDALRLTANLIARAVDGQDYPVLDLSSLLWMSIPAWVAAFILSGMKEECGWRGYVLLRFQARWSALTSSTMLGLIWISWHIPFLFTPGQSLYQRNCWPWAPWLLMSSVMYTWFVNNTRGSVLAASLFLWSVLGMIVAYLFVPGSPIDVQFHMTGTIFSETIDFLFFGPIIGVLLAWLHLKPHRRLPATLRTEPVTLTWNDLRIPALPAVIGMILGLLIIWQKGDIQ